LRYAEVSSIENPVGPPIPNGPHLVDEAGHISSTVTRQEAGNVLQQNPTGSNRLSDSEELECEDAALSVKAASLSGNTEVLAREPSDEEVDPSTSQSFVPPDPPTLALVRFGSSVCSMHAPVSRVLTCHVSYVVEDGRVGPVGLEDAALPRV
jgi:hypothetical protein